MTKSHHELFKAAKSWWKEKRPMDYSENDHINNATINCFNGRENKLAKVVAKIVKESQPCPHRPRQKRR